MADTEKDIYNGKVAYSKPECRANGVSVCCCAFSHMHTTCGGHKGSPMGSVAKLQDVSRTCQRHP